MKCRHCAAPLALPLIDLGSAPPSNAYPRVGRTARDGGAKDGVCGATGNMSQRIAYTKLSYTLPNPN